MPYSRGKREPSEKPEHVEGEEDMDESVDEEAERDGEGADTSSLLSCPVEGCIRTYQKYHNLERHLLFGKCKLVSKKYNLLDTAKLAYVERVQECSTIQPTLAVPTTTEVSCPLVQGWALKGTKKATRFNENQRQYLDSKFQIGQESGHKADPEKVSRDMRYARRDSGERCFDVEEFLTAQQIQSYFACKKKKKKVKSAYEPSGPPGRSLSRFPWHEATRNISTPPWMGCQSIAGLPPALNSPVPIYTPGWREAP